MTTPTRRRVLAGVAGTGALLSLGACADDDPAPATGGSPLKVRFGYIADFTGASVVALAGKLELWDRFGLQPELKVFTNGPLQVQALGAGDLDFGYVGPGAMWLPATGKAKVIAINSLGFADRIIAQAGITSVAQLRGKRVGVPEGTSGDMILRLALRQAGMSIADVQKVAMDASTVVTAFGARQIDAAGIWYPLVGTIKQRVPDLVELARNEDFYPRYSFPSAFVGRNEVVADKPELLKRVLRLVREATDRRAGDVDAAVTLTAALLKAPVEQLRSEAANARFLTSADLAAKSGDGTVTAWLAGLNALFKEFGKVTGDVDPATYYDAAAYAAQ
ncbi:aliphatic sulfonate ABC transporter substrate-binding protein [Dactylosporangium maewongense]|uniref:aliphatic sulfonate ABC transporter substrate-binding protein n=1 Tax=Dactylosporangium maewongense TaxID=634393 RepID=UPI0031DCFFEA